MRRPLPVLLALALAPSCGGKSEWPASPTQPWRAVVTRAGPDGLPRSSVILEKGDPPSGPAATWGLRRSASGMATASAPPPGGCGKGRCGWMAPLEPSVERGVVALLGATAVQEVQEPAMNHAEVVAAVQLRMQELAWRVLDLPAGQWPGPGDPDPRKTSVRSLVKVRRASAPPLHLATGDTECMGIVALFDAEGKRVLDWLHVELPGPRCAPLATVPPLDLDGDGAVEAAIYSGHGDPETGLYRAVVGIRTEGSPELVPLWRKELVGECFQGE